MADANAERIAALEAELAALRSEMQDFSYTVSHDLRANLRHILSYAQLVQEDAAPLLPPETLGFVTTITDAARLMGAQMDGLMEMAHMGTLAVAVAPLGLPELVRGVVAQTQQKHPEARIAWQVLNHLRGTPVAAPAADRSAAAPVPDRSAAAPAPGVPGIHAQLAQPGVQQSTQADAQPGALPDVLADAALLRAALLQLLDNAVKFTAHKDLRQITISARHDTANARLLLQVQDNGAGFKPALQSQLFKPFARLHTAKQFPGIGMGLALARKMLARMGAELQIEGALDAGCTVRISLPVQPAQGLDSASCIPGPLTAS